MASSDGSTQPKKKKKRIKSKNKDEPCAFESSSISFSQHLMNPINFSMNNQPYYMSSNMQNTPMPMMASPLVTSPEQDAFRKSPYAISYLHICTYNEHYLSVGFRIRRGEDFF